MEEALDLRMNKLNTMAKNLGHVTIDFSQMSMYEVYVIQNVTVVEMKVREGIFIKQVCASNKIVIKMKKTVKETY